MIYPGWKNFVALTTQAADEKVLDDLFKFFLTSEEQKQMGKRILLIQALLKGELTQREIAKKLEISISKITRGSNMLKETPHQLKKFLDAQLD